MTTKKPIDIASLDKNEFHEWVNTFDIVLSDCDGEKLKFPCAKEKNQ